MENQFNKTEITNQPTAGLYTGSQEDPNPSRFSDSLARSTNNTHQTNLSNIQSDMSQYLQVPQTTLPDIHAHVQEPTGGLYTGSELDSNIHKTYESTNEIFEQRDSTEEAQHKAGLLEKAKTGISSLEKEALHEVSVVGEMAASLGEKVMNQVNHLGDQVATLGKKLGEALHISGSQPKEVEMHELHHTDISVARPLATGDSQSLTSQEYFKSQLSDSKHPSTSEVSNSGSLNEGPFTDKKPEDVILETNKERYLDDFVASESLKSKEDTLSTTQEKHFDQSLANELEKQDYIAPEGTDLELKPSLVQVGKEKLEQVGETIQNYFSKNIDSGSAPSLEGDLSTNTNAPHHHSILEMGKEKLHNFEEKLKAVMEGDKPLHDISRRPLASTGLLDKSQPMNPSTEQDFGSKYTKETASSEEFQPVGSLESEPGTQVDSFNHNAPVSF